MQVTTKGQAITIENDDRIYVVKATNGTTQKRFSKLRGITTVQLSTEEIMALTRSDTAPTFQQSS